MVMNIICVLVFLLSTALMGVFVYFDYFEKKEPSITRKTVEKINEKVGVSNNGETLDNADFYDIPYSKVGI